MANSLSAYPNLARLLQEKRDDYPGDPAWVFSRCLGFASGAIGLAVQPRLHCKKWNDVDCGAFEIEGTLTYLHDGQRPVLAERAGSGDSGPLNVPLPFGMGGIVNAGAQLDDLWWRRPEGVFDYDGDGSPELLMSWESTTIGQPNSRTVELQSVKDGQLRRYPHQPPLNKDSSLEDVDRDGRPDIWSPGTYQGYQRRTCNGADDEIAPPIFLYHSRPGGKFSVDDAIARAGLRRACPQPLRFSLRELRKNAASQQQELTEMLALAVICARAWGETAESLLAKFAADCREWVSGESKLTTYCTDEHACPSWLQGLAEADPPVSLRANP